MTEHEHLDYTPRPAESAADEIRLRIDSLDSKIATALKQAEIDDQSAAGARAAARRMTQIRDEYQTLLDAAEGPHPLTEVASAQRRTTPKE